LHNICNFTASELYGMTKKILHILLLFIAFLLSTTAIFAQSPSEADSLIRAVKALPNDTAKVSKMNDLVWKLRFTDFDAAVNLGKESLELAKELEYEKGAGTATKNLGGVYFNASKYDLAKEFYLLSLEFFTQIEDKKGIAVAYRNIGNVFYQESNWKVALDYYIKSLELREEIGDKQGVALVNGAIGLLYVSSHDKSAGKAIEYFRKSLKTYIELGDSTGMATTYLYIGNFYHDRNRLTNDSSSYKLNLDSALIYFKKSQAINSKLNTPAAEQMLGSLYDAIGSVYLRINQGDSAIFYFQKSMIIRKSSGNRFGVAGTSYNIARYYSTFKNEIDSAKKYFIIALDTAKVIGAKVIERDVSKELAIVYQNIGNYKEAAEYYSRYISLNDSIQSEEDTKRITQLEMQYEFDKQKKVEAALHLAEIEQQKRIRNIFIGGFGFVAFLALLIFKNYRDKKKANNLLEELNNQMLEKNFILNQQKEEIIAQRDEIEKQRDFVINQRDTIAEQNKSITDSIVYAQRIQQAVMPPDEYIERILKENFILFKPRDIVSGDYYWATQKDHKIIFTAADCTGHGVPGAFMSLLGISFLNGIVNKINPERGEEVKANLILNELRETIKTSLRQTGKFTESKDGMDMALCVIDYEHNIMQYAGANNPALLVRNGELIELKADKMPVGVYYREKESFTNHEIEIQKGDTVYLFSDGFIDQFGGEKGRKYMIKQFKELILKINDKPMSEQKEIFNKELEDWKLGNREEGDEHHQIDDVLVVGFRL